MEDKLYLTIPFIWDSLPKIFGNTWSSVEAELWELLARLEAGQQDASQKIVALIRRHDEAFTLLQMATDNIAVPKSKSGVRPAGTSDMGRYVEVPVMYATDRQRKEKSYSGEPNEGFLDFGTALVSVPEDHRMGELERPLWWKFGFGWDPNDHVAVLSIDRLERAAFISDARSMLEQASRKDALIFIHGFNVAFDDAARRAAQLAYDLRFPGLAMFYSWPSLGSRKRNAYISDSDKILWTQPHLLEFLTMVRTELGADAVHVIAHSMGNRAFTEVLSDLDENAPPESAKLSQMVFAAPDVNADTFKRLASDFHQKVERCTLYASSKDWAMAISEKWNNSIRAGDSGGFIVLKDGVDTVDVTNVDTSLIGHSLFAANTSVISDIDLLIRHGMAPDERPRLVRKGSKNQGYWVFRP